MSQLLNENGVDILTALAARPASERIAITPQFSTTGKGLAPQASAKGTGLLNEAGLFSPLLARSSPFILKAIPSTTTYSSIGSNQPTAVGTATSAIPANTNLHTYTPRLDYLIATPATNAIAGFRSTTLLVTLGSTTAGLGGFHFIGRWGPATGVSVATTRAMFGLSNTTAAPTDVEPSTLLNSVFMGWDAADTNIQIMYNDGSGTCTKVDLGASFPVPTTDRASLYELELFAPSGLTQSVTWLVTDLVSGATQSGTTTTDIPANTLFLAPRGWISAGGTSTVIGLAVSSLYLDPLLT